MVGGGHGALSRYEIEQEGTASSLTTVPTICRRWALGAIRDWKVGKIGIQSLYPLCRCWAEVSTIEYESTSLESLPH